MKEMSKAEALWAKVFIVSLLILVVGIPFLNHSQINDNQLLVFEQNGNQFMARFSPSTKSKDYYVVGSYLNKVQLPGIQSITIAVEDFKTGSLLGEYTLTNINEASSPTENPGYQRYRTSFRPFSIDELGDYRIKIIGIDAYHAAGNMYFVLHANSNYYLQWFVIGLGFIMFVCSVVAGLVFLAKHGFKEIFKLISTFHRK